LNYFLAWTDKKQEAEIQKGEIETKKGEFRTSFEIFKDYTEYSTIQGLIYIFFDYQVFLHNDLSKKEQNIHSYLAKLLLLTHGKNA